MWKALEGADVVKMLRLQRERMDGSYVPTRREYFHYFGHDQVEMGVAVRMAVLEALARNLPKR
jgi:aspartate carbamoyltransferase catalytic subunit